MFSSDSVFDIAPDEVLSVRKVLIFFFFCMKTYVVGTHYKHLGEALLMSTNNICFHAEIRKIICCYPLLSRVCLINFVSSTK